MRIAALKQAVNYGEQGLELVIEALKYDYSWDVQDAAYLLLKPLLLIPFPRYLYSENVSNQVQNTTYSFLTAQTQERLKQVLIESDAHLRLGV